MTSRVEELEAKLQAKREERARAEEAQYEADLEARLSLEDEHGTLAAVKVSRFVVGHPTHAYVRMPTAPEYKRYKAQIYKKAHEKSAGTNAQDAQELLARACWIYPADAKAREEMLDAFPGLLTPITMAAVGLAEGKAVEEGKD